MLLTRRVAMMLKFGLIALVAGTASGQEYPTKPIRIVAAEHGGNGDFTARLIAQGLSDSFGQQVIVDNRGGSMVGVAQIVTKAVPDGYTLLLHGTTVWLLPLTQDNVPYDPVKDFSAITMAVSGPTVLVVHPSVAANSVKELIALAKSKPGALNYASAPTGSTSHLTMELFKAMADINVVRIPYKGTGPAMNALIAGETQLMFPAAGGVSPHIKSGRLRALAVTSARPSALFPELPTVAAAGLPGYESVSIIGILAPAKTPAAIVNRLNQESIKVLNRVDIKEKFLRNGMETVGSSPKEFSEKIRSEMSKWGKLIQQLGIRGNI